MNRIIHNLRRIFSSVYGIVLFTIAVLTVLLLITNGLIINTIFDRCLSRTIKMHGENIGSIVEGALYYSMLKNDKNSLINTLEIINRLPGIEDLNIYDNQDNPVNVDQDTTQYMHGNPNCKTCHTDLDQMFPRDEQSFRMVNITKDGKMTLKGSNYKLMMMRTPILNQPSCYTAACHAHAKEDVVLGSLILRVPLNNFYGTKSKATLEFILLTAFATGLLVVLLVYFTKRKIKDPLKQLIEASDQIVAGNLGARMVVNDIQLSDISKVSEAFNAMLDHIESANTELQNWSKQLEHKIRKKTEEISGMQQELIHIERIASLGKLSSSVAHEINNPLSGVLTYTKLIQKMTKDRDSLEKNQDAMVKYLVIIEKEVKRCGDIVRNLLEFSRKDQHKFENRSLHTVLKETCSMIEHQMKISDIAFFVEMKAGKDVIFCNENQVKQAFLAIIVNAIEAITKNGEIRVTTSNPDPGNIQVDISDNGCGIAQDDIPHIFEPFFSAKAQGKGIGLGLSVVHGIVQSHQGRLAVESEPDHGTTFSVFFPLV